MIVSRWRYFSLGMAASQHSSKSGSWRLKNGRGARQKKSKAWRERDSSISSRETGGQKWNNGFISTLSTTRFSIWTAAHVMRNDCEIIDGDGWMICSKVTHPVLDWIVSRRAIKSWMYDTWWFLSTPVVCAFRAVFMTFNSSTYEQYSLVRKVEIPSLMYWHLSKRF